MLLVLPIILFSPFLIISQFNCNTNAAITSFPGYPNCSSTDTYANGTTFEYNLLELIKDISNRAFFNSAFYQQESGDSPNKAYGLIMCLADSTLLGCMDCLHDIAIQNTTLNCSGSATATVFYESCMMSYSRKDFRFVADPYEPGEFSLGKSRWIDGDSNIIVKEILANLSKTAPNDPELFSFSNEAVSNRTNISALVQCTKDLSPNECKKCITYTMPYVQNYSENYSLTGVRIMARNCYIRYDSELFNATSFPQSLAYPPIIPTPINSPPAPSIGTGRSGRSTSKFVIVAISIVGVLLVA